MHPPLALSFRHRENQDGSWDSICLRCYLTAAHSYSEQPLLSVESEHCCDESNWLFQQAANPTPHLPSPCHTCPPSAMPRFTREPECTHPSRRWRHSGQPANLREPPPFEITGGL
jgi:hypothetical protein